GPRPHRVRQVLLKGPQAGCRWSWAGSSPEVDEPESACGFSVAPGSSGGVPCVTAGSSAAAVWSADVLPNSEAGRDSCATASLTGVIVGSGAETLSGRMCGVSVCAGVAKVAGSCSVLAAAVVSWDFFHS